MKIICCLKHAPDSTARLSIADDGQDIKKEGVDFNPSPFDEYGIEAAMLLKDKDKEIEVVIVCLGPEAAQSSIRKALAMGADRALQIKTEGQHDSRATGLALAEVIKEEAPELVLFGHQAIDTNAGQVPAYVAQALDYSLVTMVTAFELNGNSASCQRQIEGATEVVSCPLPAAIACTKGDKEPRFPSLPGIMKAKKKPLDIKEVNIADNKVILENTQLPPQREAGAYVGEGIGGVDELLNRLRNEAKVI